eukprot:360018-Chlamydomonas_euryale.AAC.8
MYGAKQENLQGQARANPSLLQACTTASADKEGAARSQAGEEGRVSVLRRFPLPASVAQQFYTRSQFGNVLVAVFALCLAAAGLLICACLPHDIRQIILPLPYRFRHVHPSIKTGTVRATSWLPGAFPQSLASPKGALIKPATHKSVQL